MRETVTKTEKSCHSHAKLVWFITDFVFSKIVLLRLVDLNTKRFIFLRIAIHRSQCYGISHFVQFTPFYTPAGFIKESYINYEP